MEVQKTNSYEISNVQSTLDLANDLAKFIKEKRLCSNIQGKDYVNVEGWSYAGNRLGILPIAKKPVRITNEGEIKYECEVDLLHLQTGKVVGYGYAICSNAEKSKKFFDEYAIASMAQTRAIGKAYRNLLAWIIKAAGYEPTPAEEMDFAKHDEKVAEKEASDAQYNLIYELLETVNITDKKRDDILLKINNGMTVQNASKCIEWLKEQQTEAKK